MYIYQDSPNISVFFQRDLNRDSDVRVLIN